MFLFSVSEQLCMNPRREFCTLTSPNSASRERILHTDITKQCTLMEVNGKLLNVDSY